MLPRVPLPRRPSHGRIERDVEDEIFGHIELKALELERQGMARDEAWRQACAAFGRTETIRSECTAIQHRIHGRRSRKMRMEELTGDLRWAVRSLLRAPGFTLLATMMLAVGVAANASIFSVANGIFFRSVPGVRDPGSLVEISRGPGFVSVSYPVYERFKDLGSGLESLAAFDVVGLSIEAPGGEPEVVMGLQVSGNYFDVLGTRPSLGRFFLGPERDPAAGRTVAVLTHGLWRERFGGDPGAVGSTVRLNGVPVTVIGVAEEGFAGHLAPALVQIVMPLGSPLPGFHRVESLRRPDTGVLELVGRVGDGTDLQAMAMRLGAAARARLAQDGLEPSRYIAEVRTYAPVPGTMRGPAGSFFAILSVLVGLVLLVTCLNVAGLLISRSLRRRGEIAIRMSLGAGRGRLVRQLGVEALALSALAGVAAVALTYWATGVLSTFQLPISPLPGLRLDLHLRPNGVVLAYSVLLVLATALLCGLAPALRATRVDLVTDLKNAAAPGTGPRGRLQQVLVGGQIAGTVVLLAASGLFLRALVSAEALDPGFDTEDVYVASFDLELAGRSAEESWTFFSELRRRALVIPGVEHATVAGKLPLAGLSQMAPVGFEDVEPPQGRTGYVLANQSIGPDYFRTLGIPILRGRGFTDDDDASSLPIVVVNEALAERMWPGTSSLGRSVTVPVASGGTRVHEVVGVVATAKYSRLSEEPRMFAYFPAAQRRRTDMILHVKTSPGATAPLREVRALASELEPAAAIVSVGTLDAAMGIFLLPQRAGAWVTGVLGLFGLLLGALGVYALAAFWVGSNTRELGIRMALGATAGEVLTGVLRTGLIAPLVGGGVGLVVALVMSRFLEAFLFGADPLDAVTFGAVIGALLLVSLVANLAPAAKAARMHPASVLRSE